VAANFALGDAVLEVIASDGLRRLVTIAESPFFVGRGSDAGNHLQLPDRRISRRCAAIVAEGGGYSIENRGHHAGVFVNGERVERHALQHGDTISFGLPDSYTVVFRTAAPDAVVQNLLTRMENLSRGATSSRNPAGGTAAAQASLHGGLGHLSVLLEAATLLHSRLPLESVLGTMVDHAVALTRADRGILLEADTAGTLRPRVARMRGGAPLALEDFAPSQTALRGAIEKQASVITEDVARTEAQFQAAQSIVAQRLRAVVVVPLYGVSRGVEETGGTENLASRDLLGVLYLDSTRPAAFSALDRQILDALAADAASVLDKARLVENDRQRQRLAQELDIAREIQQALLPRGFGKFAHLDVTGVHTPCREVGGDYFDVFPLADGRTAFLIADVSGKGLGAALLTPMLQGALTGMSMGVDPASVLGHINRLLCEHEGVARHATLFFGIADGRGDLEYLNAGHPSPLLLRRGAASELYTKGSLPLGLVPEASYASARAKLEPGDTLVLFSDGVTEAENAQGGFFGVQRLRDVLNGRRDASIVTLQQHVLDAVADFSGDSPQADDITVLLVRYLAESAGEGML
jgi:sigma-B regulation protein RsbU (phosphoserine phosphatase)